MARTAAEASVCRWPCRHFLPASMTRTCARLWVWTPGTRHAGLHPAHGCRSGGHSCPPLQLTGTEAAKNAPAEAGSPAIPGMAPPQLAAASDALIKICTFGQLPPPTARGKRIALLDRGTRGEGQDRGQRGQHAPHPRADAQSGSIRVSRGRPVSRLPVCRPGSCCLA
jgi:hypothetical protein